MSKSLYIGNLPWSATEESLRELFRNEANVEVESVRVATDRETGRSRGFGFAEVADEHAEHAIERLSGVDFGGRALTVNEARPREERSRRY
ncbi:MAG: RNA-binding protein [Thermaerobacter sp.]|nr:RNA-binding protein [Thermaerobacter sp.]